MDRRSEKTVVIICAKKNSRRFPGKNKINLRYIVNSCLEEKIVDMVVLATDMEEWVEKDSHTDKLRVLFRPSNCTVNEDSVFLIARWAYLSLNETYKNVAIVFPAVKDFDAKNIFRGVEILAKNNLNEVRSYDSDGLENGLIIMTDDHLKSGQISTYCGAFATRSKEIHYKNEV